MQYFDLPDLNKRLLNKLGVEEFKKIPIQPASDAKPSNCLNNVISYIQKHGGSVQLGWIFSCLGNISVKMTAHAVVKLSDNSLVCITPHEFRTGILKFAPDNSIEDLIKNNFLPTKFVPLINDQSLSEYIDIEVQREQLRLDTHGIVARSDLNWLEMKASLLYPAVLSLGKKYTGKNDQCFCGSGKKNKKCCG